MKLYRPLKRWRSLIWLLLALALLIIGLEISGKAHFWHNDKKKQVVVAGNTVKAPVIKPSAKPSAPISNTSGASNSGGATDTHGSSAAATSPSQWVTSASGYITVKNPVANAKLQNGDIISGSAKVSEVSYRLYDNAIGKIADGTLSVVSGNFSGKLHFTPKGTGGRLDVFTTDSLGREYNEVQINVSF